MAKYQEFKRKTFKLQKEAVAWTKKIKKDNKGSGQTMKIETNYLSDTNRWEGLVLVRM